MSEEVSILVVEDERLERELLKIILSTAPYTVVVEKDAEAAFILIDNQPPADLVVTNVKLPKLSGIELTRYIRNNPSWSKVPIIALSSDMDAKMVIELNQSGASCILAKPFDPERLHNEVLKLTGYERVDS